jgi:hypothetical protein
MRASAPPIRSSLYAFQFDLNVEFIAPLLVSSDVFLTMCSLCDSPLQKADHHINSRLRKLDLLERHRFPLPLFVC